MIIGISAKKQCGKNTLASIIQKLDPTSNWIEKSHAHKLKQICSILTGIPIEDFEKEEVKNSYLSECWSRWVVEIPAALKNYQFLFSTSMEADAFYSEKIKANFTASRPRYQLITVRNVLQWVGTDAMRDFIHPKVWTNALYADYKEGENWIITDVRFPNEVIEVQDRDGIVARLTRNTGHNDLHLSETALDGFNGFNYIFDNNGSMDLLIEFAAELVNKKIVTKQFEITESDLKTKNAKSKRKSA